MGNVYEFPRPPVASSSRVNGSERIPSSSPRQTLPEGHSSMAKGLPGTDNGWTVGEGILYSGSGREEDWDSEGEDGMEVGERKVIVHLEVRQVSTSILQPVKIEQLVRTVVQARMEDVPIGEEMRDWEDSDVLARNVERIWIAESVPERAFVKIDSADIRVHVYKVSEVSELRDFVPTSEEAVEDDEENEKMPAASVRELPSAELEGLWDNLVYADDLKARLLNYIHSTVAFSEAEVDFNVVTWNRVVLLHGPPGTGKTSLCRALAQKLVIRLSDRYKYGKIVEINSHSLFSKWFSESGKLVQRLFSDVNAMVDDEDGFVVVMIDEVESLTAARAGAMSGNEPSDGLRVVNALLTQLDKIKAKKNVLVMTTSNIAGAIDSAFVDRADIKEYVGYPPPQAIYWILSGCLKELMGKGLIGQCELLEWRMLGVLKDGSRASRVGEKLKMLADRCYNDNVAGRFLRRIPILAYARYITCASPVYDPSRPRSIERWLRAVERTIDDERNARGAIQDAEGHRGVAPDIPVVNGHLRSERETE